MHAVHHRHEAGDTVDHGGVHDLSFSGNFRFVDRTYDAEGKIKRTAAEVANQVERWNRRAIFPSDRVQSSGQCDVVDVVAWFSRQRTILTPSRDAAIDKLLIETQAFLGAKPEPLSYTRPEPLDECIRFDDQLPDQFHRARRFKVQCNRQAAAVEQLMALVVTIHAAAGLVATADAQHVGAHLCEEH